MVADVAHTLTDLGLTDYRPRFSGVIRVVTADGPSTIRHITRRMNTTHSAGSQTVSEMAARGLVELRTGSDARQRLVHLTDTALTLRPVIDAEWAATAAAVRELGAELSAPLDKIAHELARSVCASGLSTIGSPRTSTRPSAMTARNGVLADLRPLRESPEYRRLWIGSSLSAVGGQMTTFAVALQVWNISRSSAAVGAIGLAYAIPAIAVGMAGGVLIDSVDRRKLVLVTSSVQMLVSVAFAAQAFAGSSALWLLYALTAVQGGVSAINSPARQTFMPRLLRRELVPAGAALTMISMYVAMISGPALAGQIAAVAGLKVCYLIDALTFVAALYSVFRLPPMRPEGQGAQRNLVALMEGLRFIVDNRALRGAMLADLSATVLAMPIALFPAINAERFGGSPTTLGLLSTAVAVGGLLGSVLSGPVTHIAHPGRAMLITGAIWGVALAAFGAVQGLPASLVFLAVAGAADVLSVVFRTTIVQLATPDAMRGRTNSTEFVVGAAFPEVGNFRAGLVATATSPGVSAVIGGLAAVAGAGLIALAVPEFLRYRYANGADDHAGTG